MLKLLRERLPADLQFSLLCEVDSSKHRCLQQALGQVREETDEKIRILREALEAAREAREGEAVTHGPPSGEGGMQEEDMMVTPNRCDPRLEIATDDALYVTTAS